MDLSAGSHSDNLMNLMSPDDDHSTVGGGGGGGGGVGPKKEEILASYDFQPIRSMGSSQLSNLDSAGGAGGPRTWNPVDSKSNAIGIRVRSLSLYLIIDIYANDFMGVFFLSEIVGMLGFDC